MGCVIHGNHGIIVLRSRDRRDYFHRARVRGGPASCALFRFRFKIRISFDNCHPLNLGHYTHVPAEGADTQNACRTLQNSGFDCAREGQLDRDEYARRPSQRLTETHGGRYYDYGFPSKLLGYSTDDPKVRPAEPYRAR